MIDTISLIIKYPDFKILDDKIFTPSSKGIFTYPYLEFGNKTYIRCVCNPTKKELQTKKYYPRLTLLKAVRHTGIEIFLKIEFSAPKLLFNNNFDELENTDFIKVCETLVTRLKEMKVLVALDKIINSEVSTLHYSKNIVFTDHTIPYEFLKELCKVNVDKRLDVNQTDFRNEGHSFKVRSNDFEVIFYDKRKDLERAKVSELRAIERGNTVQLSLFDTFSKSKPFEVLRMEVRLGSKKRIEAHLGRLGVLRDTTKSFKNLFDNRVSKKVLVEQLSQFIESYPVVLLGSMDSLEDFLIALQLNNHKLSYRRLLMFVGLRAILQEIGVREFREITKRYGNNSWYRLNKEIKSLNYGSSTYNPFSVLEQRIKAFTTVKLDTYKDRINLT